MCDLILARLIQMYPNYIVRSTKLILGDHPYYLYDLSAETPTSTFGLTSDKYPLSPNFRNAFFISYPIVKSGLAVI